MEGVGASHTLLLLSHIQNADSALRLHDVIRICGMLMLELLLFIETHGKMAPKTGQADTDQINDNMNSDNMLTRASLVGQTKPHWVLT